MAVILAYSSPSVGHLFPLNALLCELAQRGHRVHVYTMADEVGRIRQGRLHAEAVDPRIEAIAAPDWLAQSALGVLKMSIDVLCRRAVFEVDDLRTAIDRVRPDTLIVDANCWGAMSVAEAAGIPWLVFSPFTPYLRSSGVPPFGPGLRPLPGIIGAARDTSMRPFVRHLFDRPISVRINAIRGDLGLAAVKTVDELMRRAPLVLAVGGEPFEYPHPGWGDAVHLVGACAFEPTPTKAHDWVAAIDRPLVLVTTSSIKQADTVLAETALQALADDPVHVVATFPAGVPARLHPPPNATVCRFVPHGVVLDRACCAITHGGMGATLKALDRGVPVCVVPFARDQAEVARRVQVARCGTRLPAKKLTASGLRAAVYEAMTMRDGARRVAVGLHATGGAARGAQLIEHRLLGSATRTVADE